MRSVGCKFDRVVLVDFRETLFTLAGGKDDGSGAFLDDAEFSNERKSERKRMP